MQSVRRPADHVLDGASAYRAVLGSSSRQNAWLASLPPQRSLPRPGRRFSALYIRLNIFWRHQPDLMLLVGERAAARLHCHDARGQSLDKSREPFSFHPAPQDDLPRFVETRQAANVLAKVDSTAILEIVPLLLIRNSTMLEGGRAIT
jgi:hypothetical protein